MFLDNSLTFQTGGWGTAQTVTTTADSSVIVDITGAGIGNPPAMIGGYPADNTAIGADIGTGDGVAIPYLLVIFDDAAAGSNTLTIELQSAPDDGSYSDGTYTTIYKTRAITESTIGDGDRILVQVPPTQIDFGQALPRFYKLVYTASGAMTVHVRAGLVLNPSSGLLAGMYPNNFEVV